VSRAASNIPMMHSTGQSVVLRHREFIGSINGSVGFTVQKNLVINPGLPASFPWLSSIASRFQEYDIKGMVFHYVPTSGTFNGTSAALGSVMIQTSYRVSDSAPSSKLEMMNEYWSNEVVPFETMAHPIECDPKENPFNIHYVRNVPVPGSEPLMYDVGRTFVATQGQASTDQLGDLWVTYEVELKKPLIASPALASPAYYGASYTGPTSASFFGTPATSAGNLPVSANVKTVTIQPGNAGPFLLVAQIYGTNLSHATQLSWSGTLSTTNFSGTLYDGALSYDGTTVTGTNPTSGNCLRWVIGFSIPDPSLVCTITFPSAQWTTGTSDKSSLMIVTYGVV